MLLFRRFLVVQLLMLWQGGFLFYVIFVVPVGTEVLGSAFEQGRITRFVSASINLVGALGLAIFAWELLCVPRQAPGKRLLWICWAVMAGALISLMLLRANMLRMVNFDERTLSDRVAFYLWHRAYLWISTLQWGFGLLFAYLLVACWRNSDRSAITRSSP